MSNDRKFDPSELFKKDKVGSIQETNDGVKVQHKTKTGTVSKTFKTTDEANDYLRKEKLRR